MKHLALGTVAICLASVAQGMGQVPDHLKCYAVKDPQAKATYTADLGGLLPQSGCVIKVPAKLACVPSTKTNVDPTPPGSGGTGTPNAFGCYKVKCPKSIFPPLLLNDQFGSRSVTPKAPKLLCAPGCQPTDDLDLCNELDDDCDPASADGSEDPDVGAACDGSDADLCEEGTTSCQSGGIICSDETNDAVDVCDGLDNDCNPVTPDGSGEPWFGEACDGTDADECSEGTLECDGSGAVCSDSTGDSNTVVDAGFEEGPGSTTPGWTESSTNFGTPVCDTSCGGGFSPHTGTYGVFLGGIDAAETASVTQAVVIPAGAYLKYWFAAPTCDLVGTDTFSILIDGATIFSSTNFSETQCNQPPPVWVYRELQIPPLHADGGTHTLEFRGVFSSSGTGVTNFFVDDVRLEPCA